MFRNYLKIALRSLKKHKIYSFINIAGLAIGMACVIVILLWVQDELSFDRFHEKADQTFQVYSTYFLESGTVSDGKTSGPHAQDLQNDFPEIINFVRFGNPGELLLKYVPPRGTEQEKTFLETEGMGVDPSIFEIFTYPFVKGNPETALLNPHSIVLTEDMAKKYFGEEEPLGMIIRINNRVDFIVSGVIKNVPYNSHRRFTFLVPFVFLRELGHNIDRYGNQDFFTYVLLQKNISYKEISNKINDNFAKVSDAIKIKNFLVPLVQTRFQEHEGSRVGVIFIFSMLALCILMIACINFMNLSTARAVQRAKEVGLRKVIGAKRIQLIRQFLVESVILVFIAYCISLLLVELFIPFINHLSGKHLSINYLDVRFFLGSLAVILLTGLVSGSYPAFCLSSFIPVKVLKESLVSGKKRGIFRKVLVVTQFSFAIVFIICITTLYMQMNHMQKGDLGFDQKNIIYAPVKGEILKKYEAVKNELLEHPGILDVTTSDHLPIFISSGTGGWGTKDSEKSALAWHTDVGYDYIKTFRIKMAQGRFYSKEFPTDKTQAIVVNESIVRKLELESPVGERFWFSGKKYTIIGVVKDFQCFPFAQGTKFLILCFHPVNKFMFIRIKPGNITFAVNELSRIFKKYNPDYPFDYKFLDEYIDNEAKPVIKILQIATYLTILAIVISCLGLFGLSSFMTEQRTKEIGIRKVLGASIKGIIQLLSKEFFKLLLIANIISWPIAYLISNRLLQFLSSRIHIGIWLFFTTGGVVFILAFITVSYQVIRVATANPADALRYE